MSRINRQPLEVAAFSSHVCKHTRQDPPALQRFCAAHAVRFADKSGESTDKHPKSADILQQSADILLKTADIPTDYSI